jgi:hypothetical protein
MDMLTAFGKWFADHNRSLAIPMTVVARAPASIRLRFIGIIDIVEVLVLADEVVVIVEQEGICWDLLAEFQCIPVLVTGGVTCAHCGRVDRVIYPTHEALFVGHVFEPFAEWITTSLMPARALGLGGSSDSGSTWAGLLPGDQHRDYSVIVPLRG